MSYCGTEYLVASQLKPSCQIIEDEKELMLRIKILGFVYPLILNGNNVVYGSDFLIASRKMGYLTVPCVRLEALFQANNDGYFDK
jgi:hypothetical protein